MPICLRLLMCSLRVGCGSRAWDWSAGIAANSSAAPSAAADSRYFIGSPPNDGDANLPLAECTTRRRRRRAFGTHLDNRGPTVLPWSVKDAAQATLRLQNFAHGTHAIPVIVAGKCSHFL